MSISSNNKQSTRIKSSLKSSTSTFFKFNHNDNNNDNVNDVDHCQFIPLNQIKPPNLRTNDPAFKYVNICALVIKAPSIVRGKLTILTVRDETVESFIIKLGLVNYNHHQSKDDDNDEDDIYSLFQLKNSTDIKARYPHISIGSIVIIRHLSVISREMFICIDFDCIQVYNYIIRNNYSFSCIIFMYFL